MYSIKTYNHFSECDVVRCCR